MKNTSQDPDYEGPIGHEKKLHKTHFGVEKPLRQSKKKSKNEWKKVGNGRWILVKKDGKK